MREALYRESAKLLVSRKCVITERVISPRTVILGKTIQLNTSQPPPVKHQPGKILRFRMLLQMAHRKFILSVVPRFSTFLPLTVPVPVTLPISSSAAAISSSAGSGSSSLLTTESLHARYLLLNMRELKDQLASRKLKTSGKKFQVRSTASDVRYFPETHCGLSL